MINLIKNSIDALHNVNDPHLKVRTFSAEQCRYIIVEDNGIGIPEASMENIFIPFYTEKEEGMGIGLSICQQIIHMHKGRILVSSKPGIETIFKIILPGN